MPAVTCPHCAAPTALPDPWPHAGYVCPSCRAAVALALPPPPPEPEGDPFALPAATTRKKSGYRSPADRAAGDPASSILTAGTVCAGLSVLIPLLALPALIFGVIGLARQPGGRGVTVVILAVLCGYAGVMFWKGLLR